jgi:hypothetical protein
MSVGYPTEFDQKTVQKPRKRRKSVILGGLACDTVGVGQNSQNTGSQGTHNTTPTHRHISLHHHQPFFPSKPTPRNAVVCLIVGKILKQPKMRPNRTLLAAHPSRA